jgi:hypothetical protein
MKHNSSDLDLRLHLRAALIELEAAKPAPASLTARRLYSVRTELSALLEALTPDTRMTRR